jgi:3-deoxy-D-manno-octulosonic-acid transferase
MGREPGRQTSHPAVMIHAVSVGELNATSSLIQMLAQARPELRFIVSTTTATGWDRAQELYGKDPKVSLIRFPLDFSGAVNRMLDAQRPSAVVLLELEVWPNFTRACARQEIPIILVNGRLTPTSYRNYKLGGALTRAMFHRLMLVCAQEETYARRFIGVGAQPDRVRVTGTMKFDTAQIAQVIPGADELAKNVGLKPGIEKIWVCGSTGPGEEQIVLDVYARLRLTYPGLRLVIVPRKPERFNEVAELIRSRGYPLIRRSEARVKPVSPQTESGADQPAVVLGDTMGELRGFYSLADVVFVGRTLVDLGPRQRGSDMIEPAALAKPMVIGPFTDNFAEPVNRLREADGVIEAQPTGDADASQVLYSALAELLAAPDRALEMGRRAQEVVRKNQGATARNVEAVLTFLPIAQSVGQAK